MKQRKTYRVETRSFHDEYAGTCEHEIRILCEPSDPRAMLVSSEADSEFGELHYPALDIDFPAELVPSSTEGHFHLYLDCGMKWRTYKRLLKELARAGVIEKGYYGASVARGATMLRLPHVKKGESPLRGANYVEVPK